MCTYTRVCEHSPARRSSPAWCPVSDAPGARPAPAPEGRRRCAEPGVGRDEGTQGGRAGPGTGEHSHLPPTLAYLGARVHTVGTSVPADWPRPPQGREGSFHGSTCLGHGPRYVVTPAQMPRGPAVPTRLTWKSGGLGVKQMPLPVGLLRSDPWEAGRERAGPCEECGLQAAADSRLWHRRLLVSHLPCRFHIAGPAIT